ncbi:hypothetical protein, conserved [Plasmodium gonderi]|uniref:Maspardin n=1 Tax=Plasmodium gonderi TaxID=77519 RepID=A0A1Y1JK70_PLAGO|nr:hypothetical protein, conserved [Plasmodium gonderi]GAW82670.1 hypothetical protein, conserved [Plasmodium gonderi]
MESPKGSMRETYKIFCSKHPLKKLSMPKSDLVWSYYDINSKNENIVIFLHGICGTAGCYFYQLDALGKLGFRVISFQYPCYNYLKDWIKNMCNILEYLNIKKAHFFASDLGGYLIQIYAKLYPSKVESLILCNSYRRTDDFASVSAFRNVYGKLYSFLPHVLLKKIILENYIYVNYVNIDLKEKNSLEFMSNEIDLISSADLGGRIGLQLSVETVDRIHMNDECITILQTLNNTYSDSLNEDMKKAYPFAKHAIMKSGGSFPYLSRYEEVNMYILVHLRNNCNAVFVQEQINSMSYMNQLKTEEIDFEQYTAGKKIGKKNEGNVNKISEGMCNINTMNQSHMNASSYDMYKNNYHNKNNCTKATTTFSYRERHKSDEDKKQVVHSMRQHKKQTDREDSFNLYEHENNNSYENLSRKDTFTSEETVNNNEYINTSSCGNYGGRRYGSEHGGKHSDTLGEKYNSSKDTHDGRKNPKYNHQRGNLHCNQNLYEEQNESYKNENNHKNNELPQETNSNILEINHNDGYYKNSYQQASRDMTREDDIYGTLNSDYAYTSNEDIQVSKGNILNPEECYKKKPIKYVDKLNENNAQNNRVNTNKNDIFCHF